MVRRAPTVTVVLALLLSLQWATAFAHCLAPLVAAGQGHAVEICTAEGMRSLVVTEDGAPAPHGQHDSCPVCPTTAAPGPAAPSLPAATVQYVLLVPPPVAGLPPAPARAPPQQPRAPPIA